MEVMEGCTKPGSGSAVPWQWDGICPRVLAPWPGVSGYRSPHQKRPPEGPLHPSFHEKQLLGAHHPSGRDWGPVPSARGWMGPPHQLSLLQHVSSLPSPTSPLRSHTKKHCSFCRCTRKLPVIYHTISGFTGFFIFNIEARYTALPS